MKTIKLLLSTILFVSITANAFAQDKATIEATKKVDELNKELVSVDKSAALTDEQQKEITALYVEKSKAIKKIKEEVTDKNEQKEQIQALNKALGKKVYGLLNKQQQVAKKAAKEKS
ncbi:hypothetical protein EC396_17420 [Lutibacter sp. HS1-25]|uniref:hypothetical protein n=1 Tax=Lutibacter sp. HS1-25 TaxID=2485000 RepID=UPI001010FC1C|nr:hypothetical protein [Lutibacter sp. HS1-25]RXP44535.1 hypothetical protein EC396_17420 [Lutibacter sp. HS1-25]